MQIILVALFFSFGDIPVFDMLDQESMEECLENVRIERKKFKDKPIEFFCIRRWKS